MYLSFLSRKKKKKITPIEENFPVVDTVTNADNFVDIPGLTAEENREQKGVIDPSVSIDPKSRVGKDGSLQIQADHYQKTINETVSIREKTEDSMAFIDLTERIEGLKQARDQTLEQKELEEVRHQQKEDIKILEKFKKWAKENLLSLSAIAITIASLITTVIVGARSAISSAANTAASFGKSVYRFFKNLAKELGPVLGPVLVSIGNLLMTMLKYGAKGLEWLSKKLWAILVIDVVYIGNYYKGKK